MDVDDLLEDVREQLRTPESCGVPRVDRWVGDALRPGKLLRPTLVIRSAAAAYADLGQEGVRQQLVAGALSMELLHVATLVHDDIIDAADVRRGRPSVVARAGIATAIVVGDLLLARGSAAAAATAPPIPGVWARALDCMASGQLREAGLAESPSLDAQGEYASLKTAELFRSCAETGAIVAGADDEVVAAHGAFGLHFGRAFQHVDDLLDTIGDPSRMGKGVGADHGNGVPTAVSLLPGRRVLEDVMDLVAAEVDRACAALPPGPGPLALRDWALVALSRTALSAVDGEDRDVTRRLAAAFARIGRASDQPDLEVRPCHDACPA